MGDRSGICGMLPDHIPFAPKSEKLSWHQPLGLSGGVSYGFVLLKNSLDMSGRIFTAALLEACSPFDALSPMPCQVNNIDLKFCEHIH